MPKPTASDVSQLEYDEYVECRALLHSWEDIPLDDNGPRKWKQTRSVLILEFRCTRCGTCRYDIWSRVTGDLVDRAYRTVEGYALPKGEGRKVLVRKEYIFRFHGNGKK
jgi:hypothetical protein